MASSILPPYAQEERKNIWTLRESNSGADALKITRWPIKLQSWPDAWQLFSPFQAKRRKPRKIFWTSWSSEGSFPSEVFQPSGHSSGQSLSFKLNKLLKVKPSYTLMSNNINYGFTAREQHWYQLKGRIFWNFWMTLSNSFLILDRCSNLGSPNLKHPNGDNTEFWIGICLLQTRQESPYLVPIL